MADTEPRACRPRLEPASDEDRARIGAALSEHRRAAGLTLVAAAARLGLSYGYVQNVEKGRRRPTPDLIARFADLYGAAPEAITGERAA
jgi:transcriptional regulator with XRE-family HTH domain